MIKMTIKKSKNYWEKRAERQEKKVHKEGDKLLKELDKNLNNARKEIQKSINDLVARYMELTELSYTDAMRNLTSSEFREWRMTLEEYMTEIEKFKGIDEKIVDKLKLELETLAMKSRISRLDTLKAQTENGESARQVYTYSDFIANYTGKYIEEFNKAEFVQYLTSGEMSNLYIQYGLAMFIYLLIVNIFVALLDSLEVALLGWITTTIARIRMRFSAIYAMAIYSLTLPMILNILYIVINYFMNFTITYFQVAYITIAYIYLAAVIFILKDDIIKKLQEVARIKQEQLKVSEEIKKEDQERKEEKEPEEKQEDEKDKKEDNKNDEPQGSEA